MKSYSIASIESKYCFKTNPDTLDWTQLCQNCNRIPLPSYRSNKEPDHIFCKTCYLSLNKNIELLVIPSISDLRLLGKLVFSCKNFEKECKEEFTLENLDQLLLHQKTCNKNVIKKTNYTKIKRLRNENRLLKNEIEIIHDTIVTQTLSCNKKSKKYEDLINSLTFEMAQLKQTVQNQQIENDNTITQIINKFNNRLDDKINSLSNEMTQIKQTIQNQQKPMDNQIQETKSKVKRIRQKQDDQTKIINQYVQTLIQSS